MSSVFGKIRQDRCRQCGTRHFERSRANRDCTSFDRVDAYLASAPGIKEKAADYRLIANSHWDEAQRATPGGPRQARHLAQAQENFAKAYDLEN